MTRLVVIFKFAAFQRFSFLVIAILYLMLGINTKIASQISNCEVELPAIEADATLCDEYYEDVTEDPDHIFGGQVTMASQFTGDITGNIMITGDFKVDRPLRIYNATIFVWPTKKIYIQYSQTAIDEGYSNLNNRRPKLILDNCKVFSCEYLWKGIEVNSKTDLVIKNNCIIEDAERAVYAVNTIGATLDISTTTFNRNLNGIYISNISPTNYDPLFRQFNNNEFTCTSSLTGLIDKQSETGIYLKNVNANIKTTLSLNILADYTLFENQDNGVLLEGGNTFLSTNYLNFRLCRNAGIMMDGSSSLELFRSNFDEIAKYGIYGKSLRNLRIEQTDFHFDFFDLYDEVYSSGVQIEVIKNGGILNIKHNKFLSDEVIPPSKNCIGIYFEGNEISTNVDAIIEDNNFFIVGADIQGIRLKGTFASTFNCYIYDNGFRIKSPTHQTGRKNTGISLIDGDKWNAGLTDGDKYNIRIISNRFEGQPDQQRESSQGIELTGSRPIGTEISGNDFIGYLYIVRTLYDCINANDYQNSKICNNIDWFTGLATFTFQNMCLSTDLALNTHYGRGYTVNLFVSTAKLGTQFHKGNLFIPVMVPTPLGIAIHASYNKNLGNPLDSKFFINTPQSILIPNEGYEYYSPYFPAFVEPGDGAWFAENYDAEAQEECILTGEPLPIVDTVDILIANYILDHFPDSARKWEAQRYLFEKLMFDSLYTSLRPDFSDFIEDMESTIIYKLFNIESLIKKGCTMPSNIDNQVSDLTSALFELMEVRDSISALTSWVNQDEINLNEVYDSIFTLKTTFEYLDLDNQDYRDEYIDSARALLNTIPTQSKLYIENARVLYKYLIDVLDEGYEVLDSLDIVDIIDRSTTCPNEGGFAVYGLRGLLKHCDYHDLRDVFVSCDSIELREELHPDTVPDTDPLIAPFIFRLEDQGITVEKLVESTDTHSEVLEDCFQQAYLYSIEGKFTRIFWTKSELDEYESKNVNADKSLNGLYFITILDCNGVAKTKKLIFVN